MTFQNGMGRGRQREGSRKFRSSSEDVFLRF
jgi:hypothetical protein